MKTLIIVIIPILFLSCLKPLKKHPALGNWYKCGRDGSYSEFKITKDYYLWMNSSSDDINIFRNQVIDSILVISELKNGFDLLVNNDTLLTLFHSNDKIILKSNSNTTPKIEFTRANFEIEAIDSTNLDSWKKRVLTKFKKRAKLSNCKDIRTKEEKIIIEIKETVITDEIIKLK